MFLLLSTLFVVVVAAAARSLTGLHWPIKVLCGARGEAQAGGDTTLTQRIKCWLRTGSCPPRRDRRTGSCWTKFGAVSGGGGAALGVAVGTLLGGTYKMISTLLPHLGGPVTVINTHAPMEHV